MTIDNHIKKCLVHGAFCTDNETPPAPPVPTVNHRGGGGSLSVHVPKRDPSVFVPLTLNLDVTTLKDDILK